MQCTRLQLAHACDPVAQDKDAAVTGTKTPQSAAHLGQSLAARRQEARHSRALAASPTSSAGPPRRASRSSPSRRKITASATSLDDRSPCVWYMVCGCGWQLRGVRGWAREQQQRRDIGRDVQ